MRSAVPLGALGTGSFEMRADGKLNFVIVLCFSFFIFTLPVLYISELGLIFIFTKAFKAKIKVVKIEM